MRFDTASCSDIPQFNGAIVTATEYDLTVRGDTKRQFRILLVTLKIYWTKKHGFLVFRGL